MRPGRVEDLLRTRPPDEPEYRSQLALDRVATRAVRSEASPRAASAWVGLRSSALVVVALAVVVGAVVVVG